MHRLTPEGQSGSRGLTSRVGYAAWWAGASMFRRGGFISKHPSQCLCEHASHLALVEKTSTVRVW